MRQSLHFLRAQPTSARLRAVARHARASARYALAVALLLTGAVSTTTNAQTAPSVALDQFGISSAWYDPASSGQGFVINVIPNVDGNGHAGYFGGWFTFADHWSGEYYRQALGTPMWLTLQGDTSQVDPVVGVRLAIYDNDGRDGNFAAPPKVKANQLGWAYLSMSDCSHMHLHYTVQWRADFVDPQWQEMDLTRLMPNVSCVDSQPRPPVAAAGSNFSAAWYDPATSGQGFSFEVNPRVASAPGRQTLFGGWFTYAADGVLENLKGRRWYSLQGEVAWGQAGTFLPEFLSGTVGIYETTGGTFTTPNSPFTVIRTQQIGTAFVRFGTQTASPYADQFSCSDAYLSYRFDAGENKGRSGEIALRRLGPSPANCSPQAP